MRNPLSIVLALESVTYTPPSAPETVMADFYVLAWMGAQNPDALLQGGSPAASRLDLEDVKHAETVLYPKLREQFLSDVFFALSCELRHLFDNKQDKPFSPFIWAYYRAHRAYTGSYKDPEMPPDRGKFANDSRGYQDSYAAVRKALETTGTTRAAVVAEMQTLFSTYRWNGSYGGKPWADIAAGWLKLHGARSLSDMAVAIDHVYDLQHNTDTVFNKLKRYYDSHQSHSWIKKALDFKAKIRNMRALLPKCSSQMRKMALRAFKGMALPGPGVIPGERRAGMVQGGEEEPLTTGYRWSYDAWDGDVLAVDAEDEREVKQTGDAKDPVARITPTKGGWTIVKGGSGFYKTLSAAQAAVEARFGPVHGKAPEKPAVPSYKWTHDDWNDQWLAYAEDYECLMLATKVGNEWELTKGGSKGAVLGTFPSATMAKAAGDAAIKNGSKPASAAAKLPPGWTWVENGPVDKPYSVFLQAPDALMARIFAPGVHNPKWIADGTAKGTSKWADLGEYDSKEEAMAGVLAKLGIGGLPPADLSGVTQGKGWGALAVYPPGKPFGDGKYRWDGDLGTDSYSDLGDEHVIGPDGKDHIAGMVANIAMRGKTPVWAAFAPIKYGVPLEFDQLPKLGTFDTKEKAMVEVQVALVSNKSKSKVPLPPLPDLPPGYTWHTSPSCVDLAGPGSVHLATVYTSGAGRWGVSGHPSGKPSAPWTDFGNFPAGLAAFKAAMGAVGVGAGGAAGKFSWTRSTILPGAWACRDGDGKTIAVVSKVGQWWSAQVHDKELPGLFQTAASAKAAVDAKLGIPSQAPASPAADAPRWEQSIYNHLVHRLKTTGTLVTKVLAKISMVGDGNAEQWMVEIRGKRLPQKFPSLEAAKGAAEQAVGAKAAPAKPAPAGKWGPSQWPDIFYFTGDDGTVLGSVGSDHAGWKGVADGGVIVGTAFKTKEEAQAAVEKKLGVSGPAGGVAKPAPRKAKAKVGKAKWTPGHDSGSYFFTTDPDEDGGKVLGSITKGKTDWTATAAGGNDLGVFKTAKAAQSAVEQAAASHGSGVLHGFGDGYQWRTAPVIGPGVVIARLGSTTVAMVRRTPNGWLVEGDLYQDAWYAHGHFDSQDEAMKWVEGELAVKEYGDSLDDDDDVKI